MRRVVVTGLGAVTPLGVGVRRTWGRLLESHCGIVSVADLEPRKQWQELSSTVAGIVPRGGLDDGRWQASDWLTQSEERRTSQFTQFAMAATSEALKDAEWSPSRREELEMTGVCLGSGIGNLDEIYSTALAYEKGVGFQDASGFPSIYCRKDTLLIRFCSTGLQESFAHICPQDSHQYGSRPHSDEVWLSGAKPYRNNGLHDRRPLYRRCIALHCLWRRRRHGCRWRRSMHPSINLCRIWQIALTVDCLQPRSGLKLPPL